MKTLSQIGEIELIREIAEILKTKNSSILCGIGDDAAVLKFGGGTLLFTTDALLESVHFDWSYCDPFLLGRKSLAVNLSDIAAMGGIPRWAVVSIAVPSRAPLSAVRRFYQGLKQIADEFGCAIVGGDTDRSPQGWKITLAVLGQAEKPIYRRGAEVGDQIWVTGDLGASALGLELLKKGVRREETGDRRKFISAHLDPVPRVREGQILSKHRLATSLIDVSDGLLLDLGHLCEASRVGARIDRNSVPLASGYFELCKKIKKDPYTLALSGGEDYELLFTAPAQKKEKIQKLFRELKTPLALLGEVVPRRNGIRVVDGKGNEMKILKKGYLHF